MVGFRRYFGCRLMGRANGLDGGEAKLSRRKGRKPERTRVSDQNNWVRGGEGEASKKNPKFSFRYLRFEVLINTRWKC